MLDSGGISFGDIERMERERARLDHAIARVRALCAAAKAGGRVGVIRVDHILDVLDMR